MNHTRDIQELFAILHDGYIDAYSETDGHIQFKIGIQYLAEILNEDNEFIYLEINDLRSISFQPWSDTHGVITEVSEIVKLEPEILNCDVENKKYIIHCHCTDAQHGFEGGELTIDFTSFTLKDQGGKEITLDELRDVANKYWNALGER